MKPYIVIPHYIITDELQQLAEQTIKSMRNTSDVFIVSVDDGSPNDTSFLKDISDKVITLKENSGFAVATNTGLQWCIDNGAEYIGCANNDIEVYQGWLEALIEPFDKFQDVGITGLVSTKDKNEAKRCAGSKLTHGGLLNSHMQSGGLWLSHSRVLRDVGLFDERFEVGGEEDVDLFLRLRDTYGYLIVMSDKACFWHKEGATRWNEDIEGFKQRNKDIEQLNYDKFAEKWGFDIRTKGLRFYEEVLEAGGERNPDYL
jgi:GT2 family glycosyltransferase